MFQLLRNGQHQMSYILRGESSTLFHNDTLGGQHLQCTLFKQLKSSPILGLSLNVLVEWYILYLIYSNRAAVVEIYICVSDKMLTRRHQVCYYLRRLVFCRNRTFPIRGSVLISHKNKLFSTCGASCVNLLNRVISLNKFLELK